jgi:MerR family transcriptional regulator, light-induced transcriptional regulator
MTAYRYVRLGQLPSKQDRGRWIVRRGDVDALRRDLDSRRDQPDPAGRRRPAVLRARLLSCLLAGDESSAWNVVERALATGYTASDLYLQILAPCLRAVGDSWERGEVSVADEHKVTAVAARLIGRLGPRFVRRGRKHGTVVLGGAPGDPHALPGAMLADVLRGHGYRVVDLGANAPVDSFVEAVEVESPVAVGVSLADRNCAPAVADVVAAVRAATDAPVLLGGPATDAVLARRVGADGWAPDAEAAASEILQLRARGR